jgi:hypothetical protein
VLSVTWTAKVAVAALVGVPLMTPAVDRISPAGGLPLVIAQEYGGVPPEAASVCE